MHGGWQPSQAPYTPAPLPPRMPAPRQIRKIVSCALLEAPLLGSLHTAPVQRASEYIDTGPGGVKKQGAACAHPLLRG